MKNSFELLFGRQREEDNSFQKKYRRLQSKYRVNVLHLPPDRNGGLGSQLHDGDRAQLNFLSDESFQYAQKRFEQDSNLFNDKFFRNLISSQT